MFKIWAILDFGDQTKRAFFLEITVIQSQHYTECSRREYFCVFSDIHDANAFIITSVGM